MIIVLSLLLVISCLINIVFAVKLFVTGDSKACELLLRRERANAQSRISVFFEPGVDEDTIFNLKRKVEQEFEVKRIEYTSQDEANEWLVNNLGGDTPVEISDVELPASLEVYLKDPEDREFLREWLWKLEEKYSITSIM
ncbi:hypothetical protein GF357_00915 [Candidatus Dojkabacteria bacterium]|nr:hypothetical protein [Candidatus Dojkabacteria bacterium]